MRTFAEKMIKQLHLSIIYTNHCIRVTGVAVLKEQSVSDRDIMPVTGEKNSRSLGRYDKKRRNKDSRELSFILSKTETKSLIAKISNTSVISDETAQRPKSEISASKNSQTLHFCFLCPTRSEVKACTFGMK